MDTPGSGSDFPGAGRSRRGGIPRLHNGAVASAERWSSDTNADTTITRRTRQRRTEQSTAIKGESLSAKVERIHSSAPPTSRDESRTLTLTHCPDNKSHTRNDNSEIFAGEGEGTKKTPGHLRRRRRGKENTADGDPRGDFGTANGGRTRYRLWRSATDGSVCGERLDRD